MVRTRGNRTSQGNPIGEMDQAGPDRHYDVFRLEREHTGNIPVICQKVYTSYDIASYDDEKICCSELIFKGYRDATGESLGKLVKFGDLKWVRHTPVILAIEGSIPLNRIKTTFRHLSEAKQLERFSLPKTSVKRPRIRNRFPESRLQSGIVPFLHNLIFLSIGYTDTLIFVRPLILLHSRKKIMA